MPEYRPAPELVRAHEQITIALREAARAASTSNNLRGTEVLQRVLPILEMSVGLTAGVQGDLAAYVEQIAGESEAEVVVGLDAETFSDLDAPLRSALHAMTEALEKKDDIDALSADVRKAMDLVSSVRKALDELVLGEDEFTDFGDEDEGSDEPLEVG